MLDILLFVVSFLAIARNIIFMLKLMPTSNYHKTWVSKFIRKTITLCIVLPVLSTIISVSGITFNDSIAKEGQLLNDSTARFYSYPGHLLDPGINSKLVSYYTLNNNQNKILISNPIQDNGSHMSTIAKGSNNDLYFVTLSWDPRELKAGRNTIFLVNFFDSKSKLEVKQIDYSFKALFSSTGTTIKDTEHQKAPSGMGVQIVNFPSPGPANISLKITISELNSINDSNNSSIPENRIEYVDFPIKISP